MWGRIVDHDATTKNAVNYAAQQTSNCFDKRMVREEKNQSVNRNRKRKWEKRLGKWILPYCGWNEDTQVKFNFPRNLITNISHFKCLFELLYPRMQIIKKNRYYRKQLSVYSCANLCHFEPLLCRESSLRSEIMEFSISYIFRENIFPPKWIYGISQTKPKQRVQASEKIAAFAEWK